MRANAFFLVVFLGQLGCQHVGDILDDSSPTSLAGVSLTVDKSAYTREDTARVSLLNAGDAPVFLAGCSQLLLATKVDTGWVEAPLWVCVWEGFAVKIPADSSYAIDYTVEHLSGTYRFVAPLFFGCKDGEPISSAQCQSSDTIYSSPFVVRRNL